MVSSLHQIKTYKRLNKKRFYSYIQSFFKKNTLFFYTLFASEGLLAKSLIRYVIISPVRFKRFKISFNSLLFFFIKSNNLKSKNLKSKNLKSKNLYVYVPLLFSLNFSEPKYTLTGNLLNNFHYNLKYKKSLSRILNKFNLKINFFKTKMDYRFSKNFFKKLFSENSFFFLKYKLYFTELSYIWKIKLNKNIPGTQLKFFKHPYLFSNNPYNYKLKKLNPLYILFKEFRNFKKTKSSFKYSLFSKNKNPNLNKNQTLFFKKPYFGYNRFTKKIKKPQVKYLLCTTNKINIFFRKFKKLTPLSNIKYKRNIFFRKFKKLVLSFNVKYKKNIFFRKFKKFSYKQTYQFNTIKRFSKKYFYYTSNSLWNLKGIGSPLQKKLNKNNILVEIDNFFYKRLNVAYSEGYSYNNLIFKKPFFKSKSNLNFSLSYGGFYMVAPIFSISLKTPQFKANSKKYLYSFALINSHQKFLLKKYVKTKVYKYIQFSKKKIFKFTPWNALKNYFSLNNLFLGIGSKNDILNNYSNPLKAFYGSSISSNPNALGDKYDDLGFSRFFHLVDFAKQGKLFNIRRIRFKPGYGRIWRNARVEIQNMLLLKFKYQKKLTKYLQRCKFFHSPAHTLNYDLVLKRLLIRSRLFPDNYLVNFFINIKTIYLNGSVAKDISVILFLHDFIQLVVNYKYYILYRWFLTWSLKKKIFLKKTVSRKFRNFTMEDRQQRTNLFPDWIKKFEDFWGDTPRYVEVDYLTLSIFIIYEPFTWSDLSKYQFIGRRNNILYMYNWKYLT